MSKLGQHVIDAEESGRIRLRGFAYEGNMFPVLSKDEEQTLLDKLASADIREIIPGDPMTNEELNSLSYYNKG